MKKFSKSFCYSLVVPALCLGLVGVASAFDEGVAYDNNGTTVKDGYGGCVRTTWPDGHVPPECGGKVMPKPAARVDHIERSPEPTRSMRTVNSALQSKALFDTNKYNLKPRGRVELDRVAREIKSIPGVQEIRVVGYTDSRGSDAHNMVLSQNRADTVKRYLENKNLHNIRAMGRGKQNPVDTNATESGRRNNRRVEISWDVQ